MNKRNIFLAFLGTTLVLGLILLYIFKLSEKKIKIQIEKNLENQAVVLIKNLNIDEYDKLISNSESKDYDENYKRVLFPLQEIHNLLKDKNKFIYTVLEKNGKIVFGLDTTIPGDADKDGIEDHSSLFSPYKEAPKDLLKLFDKKQNKPYLSQPYSDRWGSFVSYYYPLFNKGKFLGFIAIDMNVNVYTKDLQSLMTQLIILFLILEVFVAIMSLVVLRMKSFEDSKNKLEKELELNQISKLAALGEFSSVITHEINNPLQSISGFAEMLQLLSQKPDKGKQIYDYSGKIIAACNSIQNIIKSTKSLIRNDGQDDFEIKTFSSILRDTEYLFKDKLSKHGISYVNEVPENIVINCVPSQIQMALMNLVNNSIFSIKEREEKYIKIKFSEDEKNYNFFVLDSGPALSSEIQEKIKNKFFSTKKNGEGSGVGLATIRRIIKKHGGNFDYNNQFNTVCFQITLPKNFVPKSQGKDVSVEIKKVA